MQIRWSAYFNSSGYSISSQDYLLALQQVKPDIDIKTSAVNGFKNRPGISSERNEWFKKLKDIQSQTPYISIQHCIPPIYISDHARKRIGIAVYETIDVPKNWVVKMNEMDHIVTASHFNKGVFESNGVKTTITVVPHCFDPKLFNKDTQSRGRYNLFTFMYIASWRDRKNFPALIKAFYDGFSVKDQVCLLLKTDKPKPLQDLIRSLKEERWRTKETAPIYIEEKVMPFEEIPFFMKKADVYVSPSLAEGFGIPQMHAMALGIPVVTVKYSGCLEFAKPHLCTYINPRGYKKKIQMDGLPQFKNKIWPEIKNSEIRDKMIFARKSYKQLKEKAAEAYQYVHQHLNYEIIGRRFLSVLESEENAV